MQLRTLNLANICLAGYDQAEDVTNTYRYQSTPNIQTDVADNLGMLTSGQGAFSVANVGFHSNTSADVTNKRTHILLLNF